MSGVIWGMLLSYKYLLNYCHTKPPKAIENTNPPTPKRQFDLLRGKISMDIAPKYITIPTWLDVEGP